MKQKTKHYITASIMGIVLGVVVYGANGLLGTSPVTIHPEITENTALSKYGSPISNTVVHVTTTPQETAIPEIIEPEPEPEPIVPPQEPRSIPGQPTPQRGYSAANDYKMTVEATAYWTHDPVDASGTGLAADGNPAIAYRTIAVDPNIIPWHSEVYVPGIGWCLAHDTGSAINQNTIDIAMPSREDAYQWGRRTVEVIVRPPSH